MPTWTTTIRFNRAGKPETTLPDGTKINYDGFQLAAPYTPTNTNPAPITTPTGKIIGWAHHTGKGWVGITATNQARGKERTGTLTLTLETIFERLLT